MRLTASKHVRDLMQTRFSCTDVLQVCSACAEFIWLIVTTIEAFMPRL